jgi:uncharacterized delta-60 repeat protein
MVVAVRRNAGFELRRFTAGGAVDTSFGAGGVAPVASGTPGSEFDVARMTVDAAGRIVVVGRSGHGDDVGYVSRALVGRFTSDGKPDASFGSGAGGRGVVEVSLGGTGFMEWATAILARPDGTLVLAGARPYAAFGEYRWDTALVGLNVDGSVDRTFGVDGRTILHFSNSFIVNDLAAGAAGAIYGVAPAGTAVAVVRLRADGSVDRLFGAGGSTVTDFGAKHGVYNQTPTKLLVQTDGKPVVVLAGGADVLMARYTATGTSASTVTAAVSGGVLRITGTAAADTIRLSRLRGAVQISGVLQVFPTASFSRVEIAGLSGADVVDVSGMDVGVSVDAGPGNDWVLGGSRNDGLRGGDGNDTVFGGGGDDTLFGGVGDDYLNGGPGADQVFGDAGNDQVFAVDGRVDTVVGGAGYDRVKADDGDFLRETEGLLA